MTSLWDLQTGDLGFGPIHGRAGRIIGFGELAVAPFAHLRGWKQWYNVRHCGWIVRAAGAWTDPSVVSPPLFAQAMPSGFQIIEIMREHWTSEWVYLRPNYAPGQVTKMSAIGYRMAAKKIPYGFEDYAAIGGHRFGLHSKDLDDFIARVDSDGDPQRAICSQALDAALTLSGGLDDGDPLDYGRLRQDVIPGKVFDDGRLPQDVIPSELYLRILELGTQMVFRPGVA